MKIIDLRKIQNKSKNTKRINSFAEDVDKGLSLKNKAISSKYFYDDIGSSLFQKITKHPDYYLTKNEIEILNKVKLKLPNILKIKEIDIIELGPGDGSKSKIIIEGFLKNNYIVNYYPIDISKKALKLIERNIKENNRLNINGIVSEYIEGLNYVKNISKNKQLILFLGSNIGNFEKPQSVEFMKSINKNIKKDSYIFIGFDLKKDPRKLNKAYNDSSNLTKKFNLNLLTRINNDMQANFNLNKFVHYGTYNPLLGAMESFLISKVKHQVNIKKIKKIYSFKAYETIHLEYSFKYSIEDIEDLAKKSKFTIQKYYKNIDRGFTNSLWKK